jgi:DNA-binding CsgD family transcriptional regulator
VEKLEHTDLSPEQEAYVRIIRSHVKDIISPFVRRLSSQYLHLTPREIKVAGLVRNGMTSKEIAEILCISTSAVDFHRKNLRMKLGIKGQKANLRSHLLTMAK